MERKTETTGHTGRRIKGRFALVRTINLRRDWHKKRFKKQNGKCALCKEPMITPYDGHPTNTDFISTLDHIIPLSKGGSDHWENTQAVHYKCNQEKRDKCPSTNQ